MKRLITILAVALIMASAPARAFDLNSIIGGLAGGQQSDTTSTSGGNSGGLGDVIGGVAAALGLGNDKADIAKLAGEWAYSAPAVTFKSDNFLLKAGGAAAATTVEKKLEPYYKTAGLDKLTLTIGEDSTFVFKTRRLTLKGVIERHADSGNFVFKFQAFKAISLGSMTAYIKLTGNSRMALTFDVSKLMKIIEMAGSISGSSTIKGASALLNQYDGLTAGFDLKRTK